MIPVPEPSSSTLNWQQQLRDGWRDGHALLAHLGLDAGAVGLDPDSPFPLRVPRAFSDRMRPGDPDDPLLRQVLPLTRERIDVAGFSADPVGDTASRAGHGLLHKYTGRVLVITTGACAIHCRYCFRREFPYSEAQAVPSEWDALADYLRAHREVSELILSGGDPLMLTTDRLRRLTDRLLDLGHIRRLRIHSRMPVTLPARVDAGLTDWLAGLPWDCVVVVHANHAQEFDGAAAAALGRLRDAGAWVLNQAVLLAGVNDDAERLQALMETGFEAGALPYYLHLLDRVAGSAHFDVDEPRARGLVDALRVVLPGYLVPRLVRERAGAPYKLPVL
ncbi:EF-P beta-lysylation protein EpmB [Wenzhouxiangella sp. XN79A]|uniref:EF-P beta-lysylation protein EpmB n=1 Tax=Wenzhouxiangella sp. XN79A TaxID=2724193 RepID=UPI00144A7E57|nr:EF-P beta-lysylation protein EpmB [Wenzhouxiangella sp. XN79A]NKI36016.1 EF-P beta-lysylation protein EpmB [Wenzhouxiangella sp. XN79A]